MPLKLSRRWFIAILSLIAAIAVLVTQSPHVAPAISALAQGNPTAEPKYEGKVTAPEFPIGLEWINVAEPLTMTQLRGKIVMLDFWTYGCINCIHIIPELKRLESEFSQELIIVGVHSAKFKNEGDTANIREIVQRYEVTHPVVNDYDYDIWNQYGIEAWPTVVLLDPLGKIIGRYSGEGVYSVFAPVLATMVKQWDARQGIDRKPIATAPELANAKPKALSFPGKILADPVGNRLFISDSNHNRIVVADLNTFAVKTLIGNGSPLLKDGSFTSASFYRPQGLSLTGDMLYVADTENHAIRAVDLKANTVTTLAGTGEQALKRNAGGDGLKTQLNSPWDVSAVGDTLYIAMAGTHQLWKLDLKNGTVAPFAGSGREGLVDGNLLDAEMAQPSGLISDGKALYFTDPEASAIRTANFGAGTVSTYIGTGLFDFGDKDGAKNGALIQHALGITLGRDGAIYIADTYNHKIKQIDPATSTITTIAGSDKKGFADGVAASAAFNEPGGLSFANGKLYIADTNNDAIRVLDLASKQVTTVKFPNEDILIVEPPTKKADDVVTLPAQTVAPGSHQLVINISVPAAYKFNATAPFDLHIDSDATATFANNGDVSVLKPTMPLSLAVTLKEGTTTLAADSDVYYCDAINEQLCYVSRLSFALPVTVAANGAETLKLDYLITPPKVPNSTFKP